MCWCNGFLQLAHHEYDKTQIASLDRHTGMLIDASIDFLIGLAIKRKIV
ncbi:hypothetical protein [Rubritalea tangerina]